MIDEKKLIEALKNRDERMDFSVPLNELTIPEVTKAVQAIVDKMLEGFINLTNAQPKVGGGWINSNERLPNPFESVLMCIPEDAPLPIVHEGYLTNEDIWVSLYHEAYTLDEVPFWMPMPEPPKGCER